MKVFTLAGVLLLCACFAAVETTGTAQTASPQPGLPQITKGPQLEFADANGAVIAWTSKQGANMGIHYSTDPNNLNDARDVAEKQNGDNHRVRLALQPNTTYYFIMTTSTGQQVGPIYSFKTPDKGQPPIHEQALTPFR